MTLSATAAITDTVPTGALRPRPGDVVGRGNHAAARGQDQGIQRQRQQRDGHHPQRQHGRALLKIGVAGSGISETGGGSVSVTNTGGITISTRLPPPAGAIALTANGAANDVIVNAGVSSGSGPITLMPAAA